jgi:23S rRNA (cytosine1962-C5)-methyltransferase
MNNDLATNDLDAIETADAGPTAEAAHAPGVGAAAVVLKPRKSKPFFGRHPWVLDSAVDRIEADAADGDAVDGNGVDGSVVELLTDRGRFVARGVLNRRSRLRVRLYTWDAAEALDDAFWRQRIAAALRLRQTLGYDDPAGACRLVFSEADGLSGLIVDRYADQLVVQVNALAIDARLNVIVPALAELTGARGVTLRSEAGIPKLEGIEPRQGPAWGTTATEPVFIVEHGLRYGVDLATGQKTGFYLDQRENRRAAAAYFAGRRVLDMFCYSGGFSLAASRLGSAVEVLAIDSSQKALALAQANANLNEISNVRFHARDCFEALDELHIGRQRFGGIVLDPPKFTRSRQSVDDALRAYHRINRLAVELLEPEGILVTCSCSGSVSRDDFLFMLSGVSQKTGRAIQVLEQRGPSPDHPVSATCLEGEYLKCFICRVA